ncbi:MAG: hypothetical protein IJR87_05915 [Bacteroidaceae bacterium]|nr:hypothetical protein [Bacteroidaceae bacterium]
MNVSERQFAKTVAEHKSTIYTVCYMFSQDADTARYCLYSLICGAIVGAVCGIKIHTSTMQQYQDIIDQIEDLTAGE